MLYEHETVKRISMKMSAEKGLSLWLRW